MKYTLLVISAVALVCLAGCKCGTANREVSRSLPVPAYAPPPPVMPAPTLEK